MQSPSGGTVSHSSRPHRRGGPWPEEWGGQARLSVDRHRDKELLRVHADDRQYAIWQLALVGGLRRGELCGLKWKDIDLNKGTVRIERTGVTVNGQPVDSKPKTKQSRRTLSRSLVVPHLKALKSLLAAEEKLAAGRLRQRRLSRRRRTGQAVSPRDPLSLV